MNFLNCCEDSVNKICEPYQKEDYFGYDIQINLVEKSNSFNLTSTFYCPYTGEEKHQLSRAIFPNTNIILTLEELSNSACDWARKHPLK